MISDYLCGDCELEEQQNERDVIYIVNPNCENCDDGTCEDCREEYDHIHEDD